MRWLLPALALLTGCAHSRGPLSATVPSSVVQSPPAPQVKTWRDNAEYELAIAAVDPKATPAEHLTSLDKWTAGYPATEYIDERQDMFLQTYVALNQPREAFDKAQEILKSHPANFPALAQTVALVTKLMPPAAADLDTAEKAANGLIDRVDFAPATKPPEMTDEQWTRLTLPRQVKPYAEQVLIAIYGLRKDDKRAEGDLTKLVRRDPTLAQASYTLGLTMMRLIKAEERPEDQPPAFYHIARAVVVDGPNALTPAQRQAIRDYLTKAYTAFHGSPDGLDRLLEAAKTGPFPPANFRIPSTVDVARERAQKR